MSPGRVIVVGLGPAGADLLVPAARAALTGTPRRVVRTSRHPAVADLMAEGVEFESFDELYDRADGAADLYAEIAARLVDMAGSGDVAYAVPGNPAVLEHSVTRLRGLLEPQRLVIVPGLSFAELAWTRLGVDPTDGARVCDGTTLPAALPAGPLLISHCHSRLVLSDVKLALLERLDGDGSVTVLQRLGLPDEAVRRLRLAELDREVEPDHLTAVFADVPPGGPGAAWEALVALIERLRGPGGCPWDAEQTHHSLARHLVEETYEVVEAIDALPASAPGGREPVPDGAYEALEEELGDLACQVVFHATFAREAGAFTVTDVLAGIHDKLTRRHPHVFGDVSVSGADEVVTNWEEIKRQEKGSAGLMDDVPRALPSLLYTHKLYRKAESAGVSFSAEASLTRALDHTRALGALLEAGGGGMEEGQAHLAEALSGMVHLARLVGADGETALRGWASAFRERFRALEREAAEAGVRVGDLDPDQLVRLWSPDPLVAPGD